MSTDYDLVIIGGGITGLGLFTRAAREGLRVLLLDRGEIGGATTAVTSGLFHGGLRYLPYDVPTSLLMGREVGRLCRDYEDLVHRDVFLWPVYPGHRYGMDTVETLLEHYDAMRDLRGGRLHVRLSAGEALKVEPALEPKGLKGALCFDEWRVDVPGLVARLVEEGKSDGGRVLAGHRVTGFERVGKVLGAVRVVDAAGRPERIKARVFVNAAGPWAEEVATMAGCTGVRLTLRKGVHLILKGATVRHGLIFPGPGGRYIGVYPRPDGAWVGPTDDPYTRGADAVSAAPEEARAIEAALLRVLPGCLARSGGAAAGLRPLFRQSGPAALFSRDFVVTDHAGEGSENFLSVTGGKLTSFRPMADKAVAQVLEKLDRKPAARAGSDDGRFPGGVPAPLRWAGGRGRGLALPVSACLLGGAFLRHFYRKWTGERREGLALFRETFSR